MQKYFSKSDAQIQQDVLNEIKWEPSVTASQLNISTKDGIVTLRGSVPHYFEKSQAEEAVQRVSGVRAIANEVEVDLMGSYERSDEQIAEAALNAIEWSYSAAKDLKITVEKGWITLKGEADWDYQRVAAKNAVSKLMGVCGVTNYITVKTKILSSDIKKRIEQAFVRSAIADGRTISVSVTGGVAKLSGSVHSFSEKSKAENVAWMAPGITTVQNNLIISDVGPTR
jgi:osmotically-inducible protein OsmY